MATDDPTQKPPPPPPARPAGQKPSPVPPVAPKVKGPSPGPGPLPPPSPAKGGGSSPLPPRSAVPLARPPSVGKSGPTHAQIDAALAALDRMDYFQILKLSRQATPAEVKRAFHQGSRAYHPDRFYGLADQVLREKINLVYKRMTEAYYVLREDTMRTKYIADIDGPDRNKKLRFTEVEEVQTKTTARKEQEEQVGTTPKGRQFFKTGMADFEASRYSAAERNFKMALTYEPANVRYKEKLNEVQQKLYQESKEKGDAFKIK